MTPLIIDSNNLCYISRHAFGEDLTHEEEQVGILWGFFNQVWHLAKQFKTHKFLFAWDSRQSYRRQEFPAYKAGRHTESEPGIIASNDAIYGQFVKLRAELLPQFGFRNVFHCVGIEADDIVASLVLNTKWWQRPVVVSTDKDLYQLLDDCDIWRPLPGTAKELMTGPALGLKHDITPVDWVRMRALTGDPSDNLSGVYGVGEKVALKYMRGQLKVGSKVRTDLTSPEAQSIIELNTKLMTLPHPKTPRFKVARTEEFLVSNFIRICDRYGFRHFLKPDNLMEWRQLFDMEV